MSNIVLILVSVFDPAVGDDAPCMCVNSEAAAIRIFTNEVNRYDPNNLLSTNKIDFSLYVVGEFDLATGSVVKYRDWETDRKSTRLNSSHRSLSRMPSSA